MQKTALVTGGSRGIGAACVKALAQDGYKVFVGYKTHSREAGQIAVRAGGTSVCADVSDSAAVAKMFGVIGSIDTLVLCAGVAHYGLFTDTTEQDVRLVFDTNVIGTINCCRAAIPSMVREKSGRIITMSSVWGIAGASCESVYAASKAAVIGLTKSLAKELAPSGICVNCVAPGIIDTDMLSALSQSELDALRKDTPLGRLGTPEDVAALVRYLASDAAAFVTGQVISPNGGFLI